MIWFAILATVLAVSALGLGVVGGIYEESFFFGLVTFIAGLAAAFLVCMCVVGLVQLWELALSGGAL